MASLTELEAEFEDLVSAGAPLPPLSEAQRGQLIAAFSDGVITAETLARRLAAFPAASLALVSAFEGPLWPSLEELILRSQRLSPEAREAARQALEASARGFSLRLSPGLARSIMAGGLHSFKLRAHSDPMKIKATFAWFGEAPQGLLLVLAPESCPWRPSLRVEVGAEQLAAEGEEAELELALPASLEPGRYEAHVIDAASGAPCLDREGRPCLALTSAGDDEALAASVAAEGELAQQVWRAFEAARKERSEVGRHLRRGLTSWVARSGQLGTIGEAFQRTASAPEGSLNGRTHAAIREVLRRREVQGPLLAWVGADVKRARALARESLPAASMPAELPAGHPPEDVLEAWREADLAIAGLLALSAGDEVYLEDDVGEIATAWRDADGDSAPTRVSVSVEGRKYRLKIQERKGDALIGVLTCDDDEEVEVRLTPYEPDEEDEAPPVAEAGELFEMIPEIARNGLFLASGVLVSTLMNAPGKSKTGLPVTAFKPAYASLVRPKLRPKATRLCGGMDDARRLALSVSRGIAESAADQSIIGQLLRDDGPPLDPPAYGAAMIEWAIPLPSGGNAYKQKLWALDRESQSLARAGAAEQSRALKGIDSGAQALLKELQSILESGRGNPAPLALEKAALRIAMLARSLARLPAEGIADDISEGLAKVEDIAAEVCPKLVRSYALLVELILRDGA